MKHERTTEEIAERAALYALGALSQHEARAFEAHLRDGCSVCETELRTHERVAEALGLAASPAPPPPYVRDLLTARVEREAQEGPPRGAPAPPAVRAAPERPKYPNLYETLHPTPPPRPRRSVLPWAAALIILAGAAAGLVMMRRQFDELLQTEQQDGRAARLDNVRLRRELDATRRRAEDLEALRAAITNRNVRVIELAGQSGLPPASAKIHWDTDRSRWLVAVNLPPAPAGKVYQLWFVTPTAKISAGLIPTDAAGQGLTFVDVPPTLQKLAAAAITLEPEGGSEQPTLPIYALGRIG